MQLLDPSAAIPDKLPIRHKDWNNLVDAYQQNRPLTVRRKRSNFWQHPWKVSADYSIEKEQWRFSVKPGFVNFDAAEVTMNWEDIPDKLKERIGKSGRGERFDVPLTDAPKIPINVDKMRRIGVDGDPTGADGSNGSGEFSFEAVPNFFRSIGVGTAPVIRFTETGQIITEIDGATNREDTQDEPRLMRALEVILTKERVTMAVDTEVSNGVDGSGFVDYTIRYSDRIPRERPYITTMSQYVPRSSVAEAESLLSGVFQDSPFEDLHLATIYLVSPRGVKPLTPPDGTWTAYCQNHLYWNLQYEHSRLKTTIQSPPLRLDLALAGGVAQLQINNQLSELNSALDLTEEYLRNSKIEGRFWTV